MSSILGKRYYESTNDGVDVEEPEDDYLSDKFLAEIEQKEQKSKQSGVKTYTQLRKEAQRRKEEKGYIKPRAEREREAREEGLKRNLMTATATSSTNGPSWQAASTSESIQDDNQPPPTHSGNKALSMMMKMGFKPGEALGRKIEDAKGKGKATQIAEEGSEGEEEEDNFPGLGARKGIGSKKQKPDKEFINEDFISINDTTEDEDAASASDTPKVGKKIPSHRIDPIEIQMRSGRQQ